MPTTTWYIDGYNLLHHFPRALASEDATLEQVRDALIEQLARWCGGLPDRVAVVFDGQGRLVERSHPVAAPSNLEVVYASSEMTADRVIESAVHRRDRQASAVVVTSDNTIAGLVRAGGATVMHPSIFLGVLDSHAEAVADQITLRNTRDGIGAVEDRLHPGAHERLRRLRRFLPARPPRKDRPADSD